MSFYSAAQAIDEEVARIRKMIGDAAVLREQVAAWEAERNAKQKGVDWQFTAANARIKLKRLYPKIQS